MALPGIYRTFHPTAAEYILQSKPHGTFPWIHYMIGPKKCLSEFRKNKITRSIFADHNDIKLKISNRRHTEKFTNICKLNNILLNNQWIKRRNQKGT